MSLHPIGAFLLLCAPLLLAACTGSQKAIPSWLDALHRLPVKSVTVGGHQVAYLDEGQGPPIILVHGLGGSMWQWEYQQGQLSGSHRVITLDMLGSGFSDTPDIGYTPDEIVTSFTGFMDALGISQATLVGNSLGGGLVIAMAVAHPERVDRVVLIGGLPDGIRERLRSPSLQRALDSRLPVWVATVGNWVAGRSLTRRVLSEMVYDEALLTDAVIDRSHRNRRRGGIVRPVMKTLHNLTLWEGGYARRIGEIRQPTLIVWGAEDEIFDPEVGRHLQRRIAGSRLTIVPAAGHLPQWERPDIVNPLLRDFLK